MLTVVKPKEKKEKEEAHSGSMLRSVCQDILC